MSIQWSIAGLVVIASAVFSTWRLLAARHRLQLLDAIARAVPGFSGRSRIFRRLHANVQAQLSHGCGACAARAPAARARR